MKLEFVCVGLDIRTWPYEGRPSTDATEWEQQEEVYEIAKSDLGVRENSLQLLHPQSRAEFLGLVEVVQSHSDHATLVSVDLLKSTVPFLIPALPLPTVTQDASWQALGLDICDVNGLFSFLAMDEEGRKFPPLQSGDVCDALAIAEVANLRVPPHRPFVVARIQRYVYR